MERGCSFIMIGRVPNDIEKKLQPLVPANPVKQGESFKAVRLSAFSVVQGGPQGGGRLSPRGEGVRFSTAKTGNQDWPGKRCDGRIIHRISGHAPKQLFANVIAELERNTTRPKAVPSPLTFADHDEDQKLLIRFLISLNSNGPPFPSSRLN